MIQVFVFYLFATLVIASGVMTIASRNPVHSVLWLILAFFNAAGLFLLIGAEFLAFLLVIVYVGAVAVLFLFVVMMLDVDFAELRAGFANYLFPGLLLAVVLLAEMVAALLAPEPGAYRSRPAAPPPAAGAPSNIVGARPSCSTRDYLFIFEAAGIVLLVAMVGAIVLTRRKRSDVRPQNVTARSAAARRTRSSTCSPASGEGMKL